MRGAVAQYTHLAELLSNRPSVELVARAHQLEADILECQRLTDGYILEKQLEALAARQGDIIGWYDLFSPNADVCFSGFVPGKNEVGLKAKAFGVELNAAACLSQSQLNCLGLGVYVATVVEPGSPFQFIMFDDPVQSMDDDHHESFILKVLPKLVETHHLQVVVLTHLRHTADRIRNLNIDRNPLYYRYDKLRLDGPQMAEYVPLKSELDFVRERSKGTEAEREWAVDRTRVLCEIIIRQAWMKKAKQEVPVAYQHATGRQLLTLFSDTPGTTRPQRAELDDTIGWADPSHHSDPDWQIPSTDQIKPHIDRLSSLMGQLGLKE